MGYTCMWLGNSHSALRQSGAREETRAERGSWASRHSGDLRTKSSSIHFSAGRGNGLDIGAEGRG